MAPAEMSDSLAVTGVCTPAMCDCTVCLRLTAMCRPWQCSRRGASAAACCRRRRRSGAAFLELPAWDCRAMGADQAAAAHPARNLPPRAHCLGVCRTHFDMLRRGASRLLPRLLGTGSQAAVALQKGEAALLPRLAAAAAPADAAAALRSFRSSTAAYSSSLAESLRWVRLPDRTKKAALPPPALPLPPLLPASPLLPCFQLPAQERAGIREAELRAG